MGEKNPSDQAWGRLSVGREKTPIVGFFLYVFACSRWQCYSSHHRTQRVCYSLLLRLLRTIDAGWDPTVVRGDLVGGPPTSPFRLENTQNWKKSPSSH